MYAAGDCTGVLMLASVAAMQGRIAMWHFLGDAVAPLDLKTVSSNVFTAPEIATVGWSQNAVDAGEIDAECITLPLSGNPRAKMQGVRDGFVKLFARPGTGIVVGGVVVGPRASELIHPVAIAVAENLTADQLAHAFTVYPSMSGSVAEAARRLHVFPVPAQTLAPGPSAGSTRTSGGVEPREKSRSRRRRSTKPPPSPPKSKPPPSKPPPSKPPPSTEAPAAAVAAASRRHRLPAAVATTGVAGVTRVAGVATVVPAVASGVEAVAAAAVPGGGEHRAEQERRQQARGGVAAEVARRPR